jgi:thiol-disulfide isomerase/thioredoxin/mono/diheme cytochrome c family protein
MMMPGVRTAALALALLAVPATAHAEKPVEFTLPAATADGKPWSLAREAADAKAAVVVFLGTECPVNNLYLPTLIELHARYGPKGVVFVGINANRQDDAGRVARHAKEHRLPFPVLKDAGAAVADSLGAVRTPEVVVLDAGRAVRYRGRIDDQFTPQSKAVRATRHDLADALDAVLAGKSPAVATTEAAGCPIAREPKPAVGGGATAVTYAKQVSRILQANCQHCHRAGEAAPFSLGSYDDAAAWSAAIREAVAENRMPPWHADPAHGKFRSSRRLSDADRGAILAWIDAGCPEGDSADLPAPRTFTQGWRIGKPDLVVTLPQPVAVPAKAPAGGVAYQYIAAGEPFPEDRWITAVEARPGNRSVVHHIIVFIQPPRPVGRKPGSGDGIIDPRDPDGFGKNLLAAYVPGDMPTVFTPGLAKKVVKGSRLIFEMHYTPDGTATTDRSSVGMVFAKSPPGHVVRTRSVFNEQFVIPPFARDHKVEAETTFDKPAVLLSLTPHMHLRGKSFRYSLVRDDGTKEVLLSVPRYDFNWQSTYTLAEPRAVPAGAKLLCEASFDNSASNRANPNPFRPVMWGEQTWDEMMIGFVEYYWAK